MLPLWWAEQSPSAARDLSSGENPTLTKHCPTTARMQCPVFWASQECESFLSTHCTLGLFCSSATWPGMVPQALLFISSFLCTDLVIGESGKAPRLGSACMPWMSPRHSAFCQKCPLPSCALVIRGDPCLSFLVSLGLNVRGQECLMSPSSLSNPQRPFWFCPLVTVTLRLWSPAFPSSVPSGSTT